MENATHQTNLSERIRLKMQDFPPSEKRAAHVLLGYYPFAGLETVADFAARASVSSPSILRFVARLGFSGGYPEFQKHLRDELEAQLKSPLNKSTVPPNLPRPHGSPTPLHSLAATVMENIQATLDALTPSEFEALLDLLCQEKRRVYLVGGRFTGPIARFAEAHLRIIRSGVDYLDPHSPLWRDRMIDISRKDVILAYDIRRYTPETLQCCEAAAARGATVVLITDEWLSPITSVAHHVLPVHINTAMTWDSYGAILLVTEAIISAMTQRLWPTTEKRMQIVEDLRSRGT